MKRLALFPLLAVPMLLTAATSYNFTVRVTDENGDYDEKPFSLTVLEAPAPEGFTAWAEQIADPAERGENDDPDGDGVPNIVEYAFSLDPTVPDYADAVPELTLAQGHLQIRFVRDPNKTDILYRVEASDTLSTWTEILYNSLSPQVPYEQNNDGEAMIVTDTAPVDGTETGRFLRLVVEPAL